MKKRILFASLNVEIGTKAAWECCGFQVYDPPNDLNMLSIEQMAEEIVSMKDRYDIGYVFCFGFIPDLAEACYRCEVFYISWELDCPQLALWSKEAEYETNYIFVFDYKQYQTLIRRGLHNVNYLPICTDVANFDTCINRNNCRIPYQWISDVAFVGNLYNDRKHDLYDQINYLPPYLEGYMEALIGAQRKIWGVDLIEEAVSERVWNLLRSYVNLELRESYANGAYEVAIGNMIGQKITQLERKEACSYLASHFDFCLYTKSDTSFDPLIRNCGSVDYLNKMPLIFHYSKINIHIQLRSITSGMSLRILDVLASEGFLLTNYQPEILEYFIDGEELVIYYDFEDMYEKIRYYLEHEEERKRIAHAGYLKVKGI